MPKRGRSNLEGRKAAKRDRERRSNETDDERSQRLSQVSEAKRLRLENETDDQRSQRLSQMSDAQRVRLENETEDQRSQRLSQLSDAQRVRLENESEDQRSQRLSQKSDAQRVRLENETEDQRSQRLSQKSDAQRVRLENETEFQRSQRLSQMSDAQRVRLENETEDERSQRLSQKSDAQRVRLENETSEDKQRRLSLNAESKRACRFSSFSEPAHSQRHSCEHEPNSQRFSIEPDEQTSQRFSTEPDEQISQRLWIEPEEQTSQRFSTEQDLEMSYLREQRGLSPIPDDHPHSLLNLDNQEMETSDTWMDLTDQETYDQTPDEQSPSWTEMRERLRALREDYNVPVSQHALDLSESLEDALLDTEIGEEAVETIETLQNEALECMIPARPIPVRATGVRARLRSRLRIALQNHENINEDESEEINLGEMSVRCEFCGSKNFAAERPPDRKFTACCHKGRVRLELLPVSDLMKSLMTGKHKDSTNFLENIRSYNSSLAFASMGAQIKPPGGHGPYCFRIHGQIYHRTSPLHPAAGEPRKYAQLYILDSDDAFAQRMSILENAGCLPSLMQTLGDYIVQVNPLAQAFKMLREVELEEQASAAADGREASDVFMAIHNDKAQDQRRYNPARTNEVAMVFSSSDGAPPFERDINIYTRHPARTTKISILHDKLDPMTYPVLFPFGTSGWTTNIGYANPRSSRGRMTQLEFYSYRMAVRDEFNPIWNAGKLTQQYCVDSYVKLEANRLNFIQQNQKQLRVENYSGLNDYLHNAADRDNVRAGKALILPSSFQGSPRNMNQNFQDAMSIVTKYGKPDVFLTMTCNPKWKEITENLEPNQRVEFRPDLVSRVFKLKLSELLDDITKKNVLGICFAKIHVIEFQKRGLPHAHILIILDRDDKPRFAEIIDKMVSAEIPDPVTHPRLHKLVMTHMIHGPCGPLNKSSVCMADGKCTKQFPKAFAETTNSEVNGYPVYKRRKNDKLYPISRAGCCVNNAWVVPYNPYLLLKFNCHLNVEVCASIKSVKYLFKYVYKGHDKANLKITEKRTSHNPAEPGIVEAALNYDEVQSYVDTRYVSAPEAMWRINAFKMHDQSHSIIRLSIHLPNEQSVIFVEGEEEQALDRAADAEDTLTAWFQLNQKDAQARDFLYSEIPEHYVYHRKDKEWKPRKRGHNKVIGRMYSISIQRGELYYLRLLLLHVRGAKSYEHVRTVDGELCDTFRDAAIRRHLLEDDSEWDAALKDAATYQMPFQMRECFAYICLYGSPTNPAALWETHRDSLAEDFAHNHPAFSSDIHHQLALREIQSVLLLNRKNLKDFNLPEMRSDLPVLNLEQNMNIELEQEEGQRMASLLNANQKVAYDRVVQAVETPDLVDRYFFLDGPGGSGKTFTYETLYHKLTGDGKTVVCMASTGIAATLLPSGNTFHSTFGFGVPLLDSSVSNIPGNSAAGKVLREAHAFIWDEVTMTPHYALKAVDHKLRDLTKVDKPFGGKTIVLGGDFRQILPVVKRGGRVDVVQTCVKNGNLWPLFENLSLLENMRLRDPEFQTWLLKLGNGELLNTDGLPENVVEIPAECLELDDLVDSIFGKEILPENVAEFADSAILCTKNEVVDQINEKVLSRLRGEAKEYYSADTIVSDDLEVQNTYPVEFLNSLMTGGLPKHKLVLKKGAIVMLLRNFNTRKGLCNGTKFIVEKLFDNIIVLRVLTGKSRDEIVLMPRIILDSQPGDFGFILRRRQFPLRLAFAMTINKSQGQSLNKVGIYLLEPVFSHGQLYVAFSRCRTKNGIKVKVCPHPLQGKLIPGSDKVFTLNVVYKEVFDM